MPETSIDFRDREATIITDPSGSSQESIERVIAEDAPSTFVLVFRDPMAVTAFVLGAFASGGWIYILANTSSRQWAMLSVVALLLPVLGGFLGSMRRSDQADRRASAAVDAMVGTISVQLFVTVVAGFLALYQLP